MGKLKNILFMDVDNPNEKADGPIALRISAIVMMIYLAVISVLLVIWISDRNDLSQSYKNSTYMVQCGYSCGCLF